jgi:hypothetical protein
MRLIDADALIQKRNHAKAYAPDMYVIGQGYVMDAPTISAVPVVRGEWIPFEEQYFFTIFDGIQCSVCGSKHNPELAREYNYCPNCGARMEDKPCG